MKLKGIIGCGEEKGKITNAVFTDKRLAVDIDMLAYRGFMLLHSEDGRHFNGTFQYSDQKQASDDVTTIIYHGREGEVIIIGSWTHDYTEYQFHMVIQPE